MKRRPIGRELRKKKKGSRSKDQSEEGETRQFSAEILLEKKIRKWSKSSNERVYRHHIPCEGRAEEEKRGPDIGTILVQEHLPSR